jgi:hypothetical protein
MHLPLLPQIANLESGKYGKEAKSIEKSMNNKDHSAPLTKGPEALKVHGFQ